MDHFELIPIELIQLIIPYLDVNDLQSFLLIYSQNNLLKWSDIFKYHFGYYKTVSKDLYITYLSAEKLKVKINSLSVHSVEQIVNLQSLNLFFNQLTTLPGEIFNLTNLQSLNLSFNKLSTLPGEIFNLTNLQKLYLYNNQLSTLP